MDPRLLNSADYDQCSSPVYSLPRPWAGAGMVWCVVVWWCCVCPKCSLFLLFSANHINSFCQTSCSMFFYNIPDPEQCQCAQQKFTNHFFCNSALGRSISNSKLSLVKLSTKNNRFFQFKFANPARTVCVVGDVKDCSTLSLKSDQTASLASSK